MINKNVADYTDFDGKTNKKIVQAPGGSSSFSLAWSSDPVDYGPQRQIKKPRVQSTYPQEQPPIYPSSRQSSNYSHSIKVMQDNAPYQQGHYQAQLKEKHLNSISSQNIGGGYGYNNARENTEVKTNINGGLKLGKEVGGGYGYHNVSGQSESMKNIHQVGYQGSGYRQEEIDRAVLEQKKQKNHRPPSVPRMPPNDGKSCIKINGPPRHNMIFGDASYNYWKEEPNQKPNSEKKPTKEITFGGMNQNSEDKTSIKVRNPPGGKTSFAFG